MKRNSLDKKPGPTSAWEGAIALAADSRASNGSEICEQEDSSSEGDSNDSTDNGINVMRLESAESYDDEDINNLYKEMEAEKRFLKTKEDMTKIQMELKKIKDAGGHVVDLSNKVEGLETALKIAAKDKFDQEKEMVELRNEISDLKEWNFTMEEMVTSRSQGPMVQFDEKSPEQSVYFVNDLFASIRAESPNPSVRSFASSNMEWARAKEQEEQMAQLHKKVDLLQSQNKDKDVENLKAQVQQLSETIETLIGGFQAVAKNNPEITAELNSIRRSIPKPQATVIRETLSLPKKQRCFKRKTKKRQIWCTELKLSDFKEGPVSFML